MSPALIAAFWATSALLIVVPGPDWAHVIGAGVRERSPLPAVVGLMSGYVLLTAVVAAGAGAVVARAPELLTVITVLGAAYLVWLGVRGLIQPPAALAATGIEVVAAATVGSRVLRGVGVSGLNPKAIVLFLALLPQFTDLSGAWPVSAQIGLLGLLHTLTCGVLYLILGFSSRRLLGARPRAATIVSRVSGGAMILIGLALLAERFLLGS